MSALRKAEKRLSDALDGLTSAIDRVSARTMSDARLNALDAHLTAAERAIVDAMASRTESDEADGPAQR